MGDVAMAVPVLTALLSQHPDLKVTMVSRPFFEPLFSGSGVRYFSADLKVRYEGLFGLYKLYRDLRRLEVDAVVDLHDVLRSKILRTLFSMGGIRTASIDKGRAEKKALTRLENKVFKPLRPTVERYADVFRKLGFGLSMHNAPVRKLPLSAEVKAVTGDKTAHWIGVAPFAQHAGKVYPADLMQQVINGLAAKPCRLFLFGGGASEKAALDAFAAGKENVTVVAGRLPFAQELSLISSLDAMLSMDSGNAHMAANFGVPVVTLWGATHPYTGFTPFGQPESNAITADRTQYPALPTSVYGNKKVPGYDDAMRTIEPGVVVEKVWTVSNQTSS